MQSKDQMAEECQKIKEVVEATCKEILDLDVREEEPIEEKVVKLGFAVNGYKDKISEVQFKYEMQISELQMKL